MSDMNWIEVSIIDLFTTSEGEAGMDSVDIGIFSVELERVLLEAYKMRSNVFVGLVYFSKNNTITYSQ